MGLISKTQENMSFFSTPRNVSEKQGRFERNEEIPTGGEKTKTELEIWMVAGGGGV
jgi:hypothetical protein